MAVKNTKRANGDGSIYFDKKKNRYICAITIGRDPNGKFKRKTFTGKTKGEVKQKMEAFKMGILTGEYVEPSAITIYTLGSSLIENKLKSGKVRVSTYVKDKETLKALEPILGVLVQKATTTILNDFLINYVRNEKQYSQEIINKIQGLLSQIFKEAIKRDIIKNNPMDKVDRVKTIQEAEKVRALTVAEQTNFIKHLMENNIKHQEQMIISLYTGMRIGEVGALHRKDIDLKQGIIYVNGTITIDKNNKAVAGKETKTDKGKRQIPIDKGNKILMNVLVKCMLPKGDNDLLFTDKKENPIRSSVVNSSFQRAIKKWDIIDKDIEGKVSLHSLRHTFATRMVDYGMQPQTLKELLGHTKIEITMDRYYTALPETIKAETMSIYNKINELQRA